ncbi:MAG: S8 family serine peptidase [Gaiellaceae bacterium]
MRLLRGNQLGTLTIVAVASALLLVAAGGGGVGELVLRTPASTWRGLVGGPRPQVALGQRMIVVLRGPSLAARVGRAGGHAGTARQRRWTNAVLVGQQQLLARLAARGVRLRPEFRYARVLNGFSAPLDARALSLLESTPQIAGVYPVRAAYPATSAAVPAAGRPIFSGSTLAGFDGRGVTIALLDTGVDFTHPYLRRRVLDGIDVLAGKGPAEARRRPDGDGSPERHGTELAGLLVGSGDAVGQLGSAPEAIVLPIRVAGWQRDAAGDWSVFARTDQVLAGLERAVDPDGDGAAADAAPVALVGLAEPYAAFADGPLARASAGAARLGTLVVAPAGNDGPAGATFGSIAGPGGAPAALTVGAADLRTDAQQVRVVVRSGLTVLFDRVLPLAGATAPRGGLEAQVAVPEGEGGRPEDAPVPLEDFFDERGFSLVASRAALVRAGASPEASIRNAVSAGAVAVVLHGGLVPAGALGLAGSVGVPVLTLPPAASERVEEELGAGSSISLVLGRPREARNVSAGRVASFSSRGLAYDGGLKPDVVAPGVTLLTTEPDFDEHGLPRTGTINGASAAAAVVAGIAAVLRQARPELGPGAAKSLLIASARPIANDASTAQGAGLVDVGGAAALEVSPSPATISFAAAAAGDVQRRELVLRNVSTRRQTLYVSARRPGRRAPVALSATPTRIELAAGGQARILLRARVRRVPASRLAQGALTITPVGGAAFRVPWVLGFRAPVANLLGSLRLSAKTFEPSDSAPAVLSFQAGQVVEVAGRDAIRPVSRLDVELWDVEGSRPRALGLLARLRDLLPGRYAFGLTGRDPQGKVLPAGRYRLRLVAFPTVGPGATRRTLAFSIK